MTAKTKVATRAHPGNKAEPSPQKQPKPRTPAARTPPNATAEIWGAFDAKLAEAHRRADELLTRLNLVQPNACSMSLSASSRL